MTEKPRKPKTSAEIIDAMHEQVLAALGRGPNVSRGAESVEVKQAATGTSAGQWYCASLNVVAQEDETLTETWSRALTLAQTVQADLVTLNAAKLSDELRATLDKPPAPKPEKGAKA